MFKRVFQSLTKALGPSSKSAEAPPAPIPTPAPVAPVFPETSRENIRPIAVTKSTGEAPRVVTPRYKAVPDPLPRPADELCGITASMSKDQIRERLAFLYRRYNRATSSLSPDLRAEAEVMLDAVVIMREKHFGPI